MSAVAAIFLAFVILRVVLLLADDGFGGPVWTAIYWTSSLAWTLGVIMALAILTGIHVDVTR